MTYSVLMSVYRNDDPGYLEKALKSIYEEQTKKPDEIVVVFDGPLTEELYGVLDSFAADKQGTVKYYPQEVNRGLGEALRIGTLYCTCDYIFRMDSDDISLPERFEIQSKYIEEHPDVDVLGTDIAEFQNDINETQQRVRSCPEKHEDIVKMCKHRSPMNHVTVCMKRSSLNRCGGYEAMSLIEDYYLWVKMISHGCVLANLQQTLVCVRVGNGFNSKRGSKDRIEGWRKLQKVMLENKMINRFESMANMIMIRAFINVPPNMKAVLYEKFLRKNGE